MATDFGQLHVVCLVKGEKQSCLLVCVATHQRLFHLISLYPLSVILCVGLVNAQARPLSATAIIAIVLCVAALFLLALMIIAFLIKYWTVLRKRAAQNSERTMTLRAQQGTQEPSTTQSYALQQPHHNNSLNSEAMHTLENSVLHPTASHPLDSELQNTPPPTYSASSQYPVYIDKGSPSQSTSHGDFPPPYIP